MSREGGGKDTPVRATRFEFRYRFYVIGFIFWLAFSLYAVQPLNAGVALSRWLHHGASSEAAVRAIDFAAMAVILLGGLLRTWAAAYLHSAVVHDAQAHSDRLVADGPYRHLRNPLYLGTILLGVGMAVMASLWGAPLLIGLLVLFTLRLIGYEEGLLEASHAQSFHAYRAAVPSLWPSLRARVPASGAAPRWGQAWVGELPFYCFGFSIGVFAVTFSNRAFMLAVFASLGLYFLIQFGFKHAARGQRMAA